MKISVDDIELFTLTDIQKQVIKDKIPTECFDCDMKRRVTWVLIHLVEQCFSRLKKEWVPILESRDIEVPEDDEAFAKLVFSQPDYKNMSERLVE